MMLFVHSSNTITFTISVFVPCLSCWETENTKYNDEKCLKTGSMMASVQAIPTNENRTSYIMILHVCAVAKCYYGSPSDHLIIHASGVQWKHWLAWKKRLWIATFLEQRFEKTVIFGSLQTRERTNGNARRISPVKIIVITVDVRGSFQHRFL